MKIKIRYAIETAFLINSILAIDIWTNPLTNAIRSSVEYFNPTEHREERPAPPRETPNSPQTEESMREKDINEIREFINVLRNDNAELDALCEEEGASIDSIEVIKQLETLRVNLDNPDLKKVLSNLPKLADVPSITIGIRNPVSSDEEREKMYTSFNKVAFGLCMCNFSDVSCIEVFVSSIALRSLANCPKITKIAFRNCTIKYENIDTAARVFKETMQIFKSLYDITVSGCTFINLFEKASENILEDSEDLNAKNLHNMKLHIENQSETVVVELLLICRKVSQLVLINNQLKTLEFLQNHQKQNYRLSGLTRFSLFNEANLEHLETPVFSLCKVLRHVDLIGINPKIRVASEFFTYAMYEVFYINIDYHIFMQIGRLNSQFIKNKKSIAVYSNGAILPKNIYMKIDAEVFNPFDSPIVKNTTRLKVQIYSTEIKKNHKIATISLPKSELTVILSVVIHTKEHIQTSDMKNILIGLFNSCTSIKVLYFRSTLPTISHTSTNEEFITNKSSLDFFLFENLMDSAYFNSNFSRQKLYRRGNGSCTLFSLRKDSSWSVQANPNPILYIVDTRHFSNWMRLSYGKSYTSATKGFYRICALPQGVFIQTGNATNSDESNSQLQEDVFDRIVKNSMNCQNPACMKELEIIEKNQKVFTKKDIGEYLKNIKKYAFIVLSCGHYTCCSCVEGINSQRVLLYKKQGIISTILTNVQRNITNLFDVEESYINQEEETEEKEKTQEELYIDSKGPKRPMKDEKIIIRCPVESCTSKHRNTMYYYTEEVEETV